MQKLRMCCHQNLKPVFLLITIQHKHDLPHPGLAILLHVLCINAMQLTTYGMKNYPQIVLHDDYNGLS